MEAQVFVVDKILSWLISSMVTYPLQFLGIDFARKFSTYKKHRHKNYQKLISTKNIAILSAVKKRDDLCSDTAKHCPYQSPKRKGPHFHFTKQFEHPRFHTSLDEIRSRQTSHPPLSDSIKFKRLEIMNWESSGKKYSPHHGWQVASHWTPFPVLGQRFYICYTCYILALGYVTRGISEPPICWHDTYTVTQPEPKQWRYGKT